MSSTRSSLDWLLIAVGFFALLTWTTISDAEELPTPSIISSQAIAAVNGEVTAVFIVMDPRIVEASGLAVDPDGAVTYVVQDAGTQDVAVHAVGPTGRTIMSVMVPGVTNEDWEDIAIGPYRGVLGVYVGDIGDAYFVRRDAGTQARTEYAVIRFVKPTVLVGASPLAMEASGVERLPFVYADGASHNAETLLVHPSTGEVFVVDKTEDPSAQAYLWSTLGNLSPNDVSVFQRRAAIPVTGASGGSFASDGGRLAIRNADTAYLWDIKGDDIAASLSSPPMTVPLPPQRQGEGIAFSPDGSSLLVNSEGAYQPVYRVGIKTTDASAVFPPDQVGASPTQPAVTVTATPTSPRESPATTRPAFTAPSNSVLERPRRASGVLLLSMLTWLTGLTAALLAVRRWKSRAVRNAPRPRGV